MMRRAVNCNGWLLYLLFWLSVQSQRLRRFQEYRGLLTATRSLSVRRKFALRASMRLRPTKYVSMQRVVIGPAASRPATGCEAHIAGRVTACLSNGTDVYQRSLATCSLNGENLNAWMVQEGWALTYVKYSSTYQQVERDARSAYERGLWRGAFIAPWDWRHKNSITEVLGALAVPIDARALLLGSSATEGAPSPDCPIKGNITRKGERIYHLQNQQFYARIKMDMGGGKRWFCTPEEAEAAGWRRALR